jgi:hypothetical protein
MKKFLKTIDQHGRSLLRELKLLILKVDLPTAFKLIQWRGGSEGVGPPELATIGNNWQQLTDFQIFDQFLPILATFN